MKDDLNSFSKLMGSSWKLKKSFSKSISSDYLDEIHDGALENGALSGKLMGAGGGGYFIFYTNYNNKNKLINWIKSQGLTFTYFKFEDQGLKSWIERND